LEDRAAISSENGQASLAERKFIGKLIVRGNSEQIAPRIESAGGIVLPILQCTTAAAGELTALWLGPNEWMLLTPANEESVVGANIKAALQGSYHQLADVTDYYTIIRLRGKKAREMLMKLTTLDMHPSKFPLGTVKGSIFGRVPGVLHCLSGVSTDVPDFDLIIRRSHADFLWRLLALVGYEYGLPEQKPEGRVKLAAPWSKGVFAVVRQQSQASPSECRAVVDRSASCGSTSDDGS
jgi:heterotetrameric sarcosine oxidase gamma subunit